MIADWRLSLRIARREALRARARSLLVLVMIALPVLGVTAADVVIATTQVDSVEGLDRRLGSAQALVEIQPDAAKVYQRADPISNSYSDGARTTPVAAGTVSALLGGARLLPERTGDASVATSKGVGFIEATEVDLRDPLVHGLYRLTSGRLPRTADEVVVNQALLSKGYALGDPLRIDPQADHTGPRPVIVGVAESAQVRDYPLAVGPLGSLFTPEDRVGHGWFVGGSGVSWQQVLRLNRQGASVYSRQVVQNPPADSEIPVEVSGSGPGIDPATLTVLVLVVVMALIEVVLLAGPAFAVGARRQQRSLALMSAAGGTPKQARRVVLAGAVVLGGTAAAVGVVLGVGLGRAALPLVQHYSGDYLGPFDVRWLQLAGVAGFGLLAAFLAALVPARIAARQNVVAVLAGRRGDRSTPVGSPLVGLLLLGVGVLGASYGSSQSGAGGGIAIAGSAILSVLAMILLVPLVLVTMAKVSGRLPLSIRYAVRDASRHRSRTVPAVAAVAATVAGVVALGIATSSDEAQNRETYIPSVTAGIGTVSGDAADWTAVAAAVQKQIPDATVSQTRGIIEAHADGSSTDARVTGRGIRVSGGQQYGASILVADQLPPGVYGLTDATRAEAEQALHEGRVVAFSDGAAPATTVRVGWTTYGGADFDKLASGAQVLPATVVPLTSSYVGPVAVIPEVLATRIRAEIGTVGLTMSGTSISEQAETNAREAAAAVSPDLTVSVERGYQADSSSTIVQLVLAALGALLMLGGTLTATFLALSDARPDLATLSAVGASPGNRRGVAAAYALVVGLAGAALGAGVGFVPGVAISRILTDTTGDAVAVSPGGSPSLGHGPYLDIPWLLVIGLVLALPLLTSALVGVTARSRLPLAARLD